jgi:YVTN family beta-propeller protein
MAPVSHSIGRCITSLSLLLTLAGTARGQSPVYVLDEGVVPISCSGHPCYGPTLHLINAATGHELASIEAAPRGQKGTSVTASSDGRRLFVTSVPYLTPTDPGFLLVVDAFSKTTVATIPVGAGPTDVAVLPDNSRAYVVNGSANTISVVDLATLAVTATIPVQSAPAKIIATIDGSVVYVTNGGSGTVTKISTATNTVTATIVVGTGPAGIDISPDGARIYVANKLSATVSVIDTAVDAVLRNLPAGNGNIVPLGVSARSATQVFVALSNQGSLQSRVTFPGSVDLLDATTGAVLGSVTLLPTAVARDSAGTSAYVIDGTRTLRQLASDGTSLATASPELSNLIDAAVVTDPCLFEATATATVFGPAGGSGTITIPAPAGCAWTIETGGFAGASVEEPRSGTGPATRPFTVGATTSPRIGRIDIGRQSLTFEQTIPRMHVDLATGTTLTEPFVVGGWALDQSAFSDGTAFFRNWIDAVHVWAYPASGSPIFVGPASGGLDRPDVAAIFGLNYQLSGFSVGVGNLPSGTYTLVFFAHSSRSNSFSNAQAVSVTVRQAAPRIVIDTPAAGAVSGTPFSVSGWALDPLAGLSGSGVDAVHAYVYPDGGWAPMLLGVGRLGIARPDVAAVFGPGAAQSGFTVTPVALKPGGYLLVVFARSIATGQFFSQSQRLTIAASAPLMNVDAPAKSAPAPIPPGGTDHGTQVTGPFTIFGWAIDRYSSTGPGVDLVQAWAYPLSGGAPLFVGTATATPRIDVANVFGTQFLASGFQISGATLPAGTYDLVVFAHSTVTLSFNNSRVVRITVP